VKDIVLMMGLVQHNPMSQNYQTIDQRGKVIKAVPEDQAYRVQYGGSEWKARPIRPITLCLNQLVCVVGTSNITLLVEPI
jgi:membrane protein implicated in regulation of membrane protease activity